MNKKRSHPKVKTSMWLTLPSCHQEQLSILRKARPVYCINASQSFLTFTQYGLWNPTTPYQGLQQDPSSKCCILEFLKNGYWELKHTIAHVPWQSIFFHCWQLSLNQENEKCANVKCRSEVTSRMTLHYYSLFSKHLFLSKVTCTILKGYFTQNKNSVIILLCTLMSLYAATFYRMQNRNFKQC